MLIGGSSMTEGKRTSFKASSTTFKLCDLGHIIFLDLSEPPIPDPSNRKKLTTYSTSL